MTKNLTRTAVAVAALATTALTLAGCNKSGSHPAQTHSPAPATSVSTPAPTSSSPVAPTTSPAPATSTTSKPSPTTSSVKPKPRTSTHRATHAPAPRTSTHYAPPPPPRTSTHAPAPRTSTHAPKPKPRTSTPAPAPRTSTHTAKRTYKYATRTSCVPTSKAGNWTVAFVLHFSDGSTMPFSGYHVYGYRPYIGTLSSTDGSQSYDVNLDFTGFDRC